VTGQVAARRRFDGCLVLQPAVCSAAGTGTRPGRTMEAKTGGTIAAMPERDVGALDVAWLVGRAAEGDRWAWERLVDQYARLIWAMTRDFKLVESDAADVAQMTWLRLLEHIDRLEHPARVGSWLAATARHECLRALAARKKIVLVHDDALNDVAAHQPEIDEGLLADERAQSVREALARLPWRWQRLLELLMADPPASYAEISDQLGLPVGSIGPTRGRCLARLRVLLQAS
jgi:RNA polymerase sigma factor (sigma-70 family)